MPTPQPTPSGGLLVSGAPVALTGPVETDNLSLVVPTGWQVAGKGGYYILLKQPAKQGQAMFSSGQLSQAITPDQLIEQSLASDQKNHSDAGICPQGGPADATVPPNRAKGRVALICYTSTGSQGAEQVEHVWLGAVDEAKVAYTIEVLGPRGNIMELAREILATGASVRWKLATAAPNAPQPAQHTGISTGAFPIVIHGTPRAGQHFDSGALSLDSGNYRVQWQARGVTNPDVNIGCNIQAALFDNDTGTWQQNLVTETISRDSQGTHTVRLPHGVWYVDLSEMGCEGVDFTIRIDPS